MRKLLLILFICFLSFGGNALAHTGLESSTPQNGEVITENLQDITLTFEGKLENGSIFTLQNSNGDALPIDISLAENILTGTLSNPLESGEYNVHWSIIGADGHPIEGDLSFSVKVPETEVPEESEETPEESHDHQNVDTPEEDTANEEIEEDSNQNEASSYVAPVVIGLLIVIIIGSFIFLMNRKK